MIIAIGLKYVMMTIPIKSTWRYGYPKMFPKTIFPIPNFSKQILRYQIFWNNFSDIKFSDNYIFRRSNFPTDKFSEKLYILLTLIHVTHYTYRVSILISNDVLIKKNYSLALIIYSCRSYNRRSINILGLGWSEF